MKKELKELTKTDVTGVSHSLRHQKELCDIISVSGGKIYANFGDKVGIPQRQRFEDNYRLAMAIRSYYRTNEGRIHSRRSFLAFLTLLKNKLSSQARHLEETSLDAEQAQKIDKKALSTIQKIFEDLTPNDKLDELR